MICFDITYKSNVDAHAADTHTHAHIHTVNADTHMRASVHSTSARLYSYNLRAYVLRLCLVRQIRRLTDTRR